MPGAYSTDLRERVLVAIEAGEAADVVAEQFIVRICTRNYLVPHVGSDT